jgi:hypothetical protein
LKILIIAEAGVNHNGDISIAKELIDVAADSGADLVKFQTFKADSLVTKKAAKAEYQLKAIIDATIAAQTFALAAESQGLGIMYCGAVRQLPAEHFIKNFNLPPLTFPIFGMAVGHPAPAEEFGHISPRLPTDIVLHHGSYKTFDNMDDISAYNEIHKIFGQYKTSKDYVDRLTERMVVAHDKTQVAQSLKQMGFNFE